MMEFFRVIIVLSTILFLDSSAIQPLDDYNGYYLPVSQSIRPHPIEELERSYHTNQNQPTLRSHHAPTTYPLPSSQTRPKYFSPQVQIIPEFREVPNEPDLANVNYINLRRDETDKPSILNIPIRIQDPRIPRIVHPGNRQTYDQTKLRELYNYRPVTQDDITSKITNNLNSQVSDRFDYFNPHPERDPQIRVKTTRNYNTRHYFVPNIKFDQSRNAFTIPDRIPHNNHYDRIAFLEPQPEFNTYKNNLRDRQPQTRNKNRPAENMHNIEITKNIIPITQYSLPGRKNKTTEKGPRISNPKYHTTDTSGDENQASPKDFFWQNISEFFRNLFHLPSQNTDLSKSEESDPQPSFKEPVKGNAESAKHKLNEDIFQEPQPDHQPTPLIHPHTQNPTKAFSSLLAETSPSLSVTPHYPGDQLKPKRPLFPKNLKLPALNPGLTKEILQEITDNPEYMKQIYQHSPLDYYYAPSTEIVDIMPPTLSAKILPNLHKKQIEDNLQSPTPETWIEKDSPFNIKKKSELVEAQKIYKQWPDTTKMFFSPSLISYTENSHEHTTPHFKLPTVFNTDKKPTTKFIENVQTTTVSPKIPKDLKFSQLSIKPKQTPNDFHSAPESTTNKEISFSTSEKSPQLTLTDNQPSTVSPVFSDQSFIITPKYVNKSLTNEEPTKESKPLGKKYATKSENENKLSVGKLEPKKPVKYETNKKKSTNEKPKWFKDLLKFFEPPAVSSQVSPKSNDTDFIESSTAKSQNNYNKTVIVESLGDKIPESSTQLTITSLKLPKFIGNDVLNLKQDDKYTNANNSDIVTISLKENKNGVSNKTTQAIRKLQDQTRTLDIITPKLLASTKNDQISKELPLANKESSQVLNNQIANSSVLLNLTETLPTSSAHLPSLVENSTQTEQKYKTLPNKESLNLSPQEHDTEKDLPTPKVTPNTPVSTTLQVLTAASVPALKDKGKPFVSYGPGVQEKTKPAQEPKQSILNTTNLEPLPQVNSTIPKANPEENDKNVFFKFLQNLYKDVNNFQFTTQSELLEEPEFSEKVHRLSKPQMNSNKLQSPTQPRLKKDKDDSLIPLADIPGLLEGTEIIKKGYPSYEAPLLPLPYQDNSNEYSLILTEVPKVPESYKQQRHNSFSPSIQDIAETDLGKPDQPQLYFILHPKGKASSNITDLQHPDQVSSLEEENASDIQEPRILSYNNLPPYPSFLPSNQIIDNITPTDFEDMYILSENPYFSPIFQQENRPQSVPREWPYLPETNEIIDKMPHKNRLSSTRDISQWSSPFPQITDTSKTSPNLPKILLEDALSPKEIHNYYTHESEIPIKLLPAEETLPDQGIITKESRRPIVSDTPTLIVVTDQPLATGETIADFLNDNKYSLIQYTPESIKDIYSPFYEPVSTDLHDKSLPLTTKESLKPTNPFTSSPLTQILNDYADPQIQPHILNLYHQLESIQAPTTKAPSNQLKSSSKFIQSSTKSERTTERQLPEANDIKSTSNNRYNNKVSEDILQPNNFEDFEPDLGNLTDEKRKWYEYILKLLQQSPSLQDAPEPSNEYLLDNSSKPINKERKDKNNNILTNESQPNKIPDLLQYFDISNSINSTIPKNIGDAKNESNGKPIKSIIDIGKHPSSGDLLYSRNNENDLPNKLIETTIRKPQIPSQQIPLIIINEDTATKPSLNKESATTPTTYCNKKSNKRDNDNPSNQGDKSTMKKSDNIENKNNDTSNGKEIKTPSNENVSPSSSDKSRKETNNTLSPTQIYDFQNSTKIEKAAAFDDDKTTLKSSVNITNDITTISPKYKHDKKSDDNGIHTPSPQSPVTGVNKSDSIIGDNSNEKQITKTPDNNIGPNFSNNSLIITTEANSTLPSKHQNDIQNSTKIEEPSRNKDGSSTTQSSFKFNVLNDSTTISPQNKLAVKSNDYDSGKPSTPNPETVVKKSDNIGDKSSGKEIKSALDAAISPSSSEKNINEHSNTLPSKELNDIRNSTKELPGTKNGPSIPNTLFNVLNDSSTISPKYKLGEKSNVRDSGTPSSQNLNTVAKKSDIISDTNDGNQTKKTHDANISLSTSDKSVTVITNANNNTLPSKDRNNIQNHTKIEEPPIIKERQAALKSLFTVPNDSTTISPVYELSTKIGDTSNENPKNKSNGSGSQTPRTETIPTEANNNTLPSKLLSDVQKTPKIENLSQIPAKSQKPIIVGSADTKLKELLKTAAISGPELKNNVKTGKYILLHKNNLESDNEIGKRTPTFQDFNDELTAPSLLSLITKELEKSLKPDEVSQLQVNSLNVKGPNKIIQSGIPNVPLSVWNMAQNDKNQEPLSENQDDYENDYNKKQPIDEQYPVSANNIINLLQNIFEPISQNFKPATLSEDSYNERSQGDNSIFGLLPTYNYEVDEILIDEIASLERGKGPEKDQNIYKDTQSKLAMKPKTVEVFFTNLARALQLSDSEESEIDSDVEYVYEDDNNEENEETATEEDRRLTPLELLFGTFLAAKELFSPK